MARARTRSSTRDARSTRASWPRDPPFLRGGGRPPDRRRPRRLGGDAGAGRNVRLPRDHRLQDGPVGLGPRRAAAAGAARGLRPRDALGGRARPRRDRVREACLRRPRRALRRRRRPARHAARGTTTTRRALVGDEASATYEPGLGRLPGLVPAGRTAGSGEPTRGDTVHLDVVDRWGNMVSATPSGGWLQSSPVIPALGWPLGTRAQMFWLEDGLPSSLRPGARPRTTLSPVWPSARGSPGSPAGRADRRRPARSSNRRARCSESTNRWRSSRRSSSQGRGTCSCSTRTAFPRRSTKADNSGADRLKVLTERSNSAPQEIAADSSPAGRVYGAAPQSDDRTIVIAKCLP